MPHVKSPPSAFSDAVGVVDGKNVPNEGTRIQIKSSSVGS